MEASFDLLQVIMQANYAVSSHFDPQKNNLFIFKT